ncbi:MAG TPA: AfsR/SARP family transcriptional regulator [Actinophytocola sp.]|uniref:AfsR/SARP family transcriptional regulator n=1 Tax=Actinophytocola sp. TaxID=1872138 RepID=UPI002DDDA6AE|nr:AfsR/SARP family transcriptional regulator [Actinophytocola sp.]HEV2779179.1 AfsR/SARP family transcriptional regulator [Actinophytocola sp.]
MLLFRVLGPIQVYDATGSALPMGARKLRMLLALLLARPGDRVTTGQLIDALWDGRPPRSATANLQTYVWELRRRLPATRLGRPRVERDHQGYRLLLEDDELDARTFTELATVGRQAVATGDPAEGVATLTAALGLWRGRPYEDVAPAAAQEAQRLLELRQLAHEDLLEARLRLGQHRDVIDDLREMTTAEPLRERPWELLMLALHRSGRRAEALLAYQHVYRLLDAELGIQPGHAVRELHRRMLADDPTLDCSASPELTAVVASQPMVRLSG